MISPEAARPLAREISFCPQAMPKVSPAASVHRRRRAYATGTETETHPCRSIGPDGRVCPERRSRGAPGTGPGVPGAGEGGDALRGAMTSPRRLFPHPAEPLREVIARQGADHALIPGADEGALDLPVIARGP